MDRPRLWMYPAHQNAESSPCNQINNSSEISCQRTHSLSSCRIEVVYRHTSVHNEQPSEKHAHQWSGENESTLRARSSFLDAPGTWSRLVDRLARGTAGRGWLGAGVLGGPRATGERMCLRSFGEVDRLRGCIGGCWLMRLLRRSVRTTRSMYSRTSGCDGRGCEGKAPGEGE
jgi:hypothetical protein